LAARTRALDLGLDPCRVHHPMDTVPDVSQREPTSFAASSERPRSRQGSIPNSFVLDPGLSFSSAVLDIETSGRFWSSNDPRPSARLRQLDESSGSHLERVQGGGPGVGAPSLDAESDELAGLSRAMGSSQLGNKVQTSDLPRQVAKGKQSNLRPRVEKPVPGTGGTQHGGGASADVSTYPWPDKFEERYPLPSDANSDFDRKYPRDR